MKRTIINHLLLLSLVCFVSTSFAQSYNDRCFIAQIKAGTTQAEIDALLTPFNLYIGDGPTTAFNNQFMLICVDSLLGFPPDIPVNSNGQVDINGVILSTTAVDAENDNIFDAIGLDYNIDVLPPPTGNPSPNYHHPLAECGLNAFSINTSPGGKQRQVGLLDTGIKTDAESGLDDFFDPYDLGWNIIEDTFDPADDNGHGTHMASTITLATPPNLSSVLTLKAYKTHDITGFADIWALIEGIDKAMLAGVEIISMSTSYKETYAHRFSDAPLKVAIEEALDIAGILFVAAAGNNGVDNDDPSQLSSYPASFPTDNILAVAALDCNYFIPLWANKGATSVDIAAPGVDIWGLDHTLQYVQFSGSSTAAAFTSRVAAMLATQQTVFNYAEIKCAIINGANQSSGTPTETLSGGYLDGAMAQSVFDMEGPCVLGSASSNPSSGSGSGSGGGRSTDNVLNASIQYGKTLSIDSDKEQLASIRVFNLLGQTLNVQEVVLLQGQNNYDLEIPDYPFLTTYVCQLQYGTQSKTIKFVK